MHGAVRVGVVRHFGASQLVDTFTQRGCIGDTGIDLATGDSRRTSHEVLVICGRQACVSKLRNLESGEGCTGDAVFFRTAGQRWGQSAVDALFLRADGVLAIVSGGTVNGRE